MGKITVKHYLNKRLKPEIIDNEKAYPVYVMVIFNRKKTEFRSNYIIYAVDLKAIGHFLEYERKIILDIIEFYSNHVSDIGLIISNLKDYYRVTADEFTESISETLVFGLQEQILRFLKKKYVTSELKNLETEPKYKQKLHYLSIIIDYQTNFKIIDKALEILNLMELVEKTFSPEFKEQYRAYKTFINSDVFKENEPNTLIDFNQVVENDYYNFVSLKKNNKAAHTEISILKSLIIKTFNSITYPKYDNKNNPF